MQKNLPISIVIICKNEIYNIETTINAALQVTNDIVIVDTGSTDGTLDKLKSLPVNVINSEWLGFGNTKNIGIHHTRNNWILSIDADEVIDETLAVSISNIIFNNTDVVYNFKFLTYLGNTAVRFGEWRGDSHIRLFNKKIVHWNNAAVHEQLIIPSNITVENLNGYIHHKTSANVMAMRIKNENYAKLYAKNNYAIGKNPSTIKLFAAPTFNFIKNYIFKLGFLDGKTGWNIAIENARYTYKKYLYLQELNKKN
jgi:glycosyltransferase involved in cell wall biosynthesis